MTDEVKSKAARRTPLWLGISVVAIALYAALVPAPRSTGLSTSHYSVSVLDYVGHLGVLGLAGLAGVVTSLAVCGPRGMRAGFRYLFGRARESEYPLASRALGAAGSFVMHLGICAGVLAVLSMVDGIRIVWESVQAGDGSAHLGHHHLMLCRQLILFGVPAGIITGRFLLGAPDESAALQAGVKPPSFSVSLQLLAILVVPALISFFFLRFPTLAD